MAAESLDQIAADLATIYGETAPQAQQSQALTGADLAARIAALHEELQALQAQHAAENPPAPAEAPAAGGVDDEGLYTVQAHDSLASIAAAFGVDPAALFRANQQAGRLIVPDALTTGARLVVPVAPATTL